MHELVKSVMHFVKHTHILCLCMTFMACINTEYLYVNIALVSTWLATYDGCQFSTTKACSRRRHRRRRCYHPPSSFAVSHLLHIPTLWHLRCAMEINLWNSFIIHFEYPSVCMCKRARFVYMCVYIVVAFLFAMTPPLRVWGIPF